MPKLWHIYDVNCDCCSYQFARRTPGRWLWGPRCRGCSAILGWMQYRFLGKAAGENEHEALKNWKEQATKPTKET